MQFGVHFAADSVSRGGQRVANSFAGRVNLVTNVRSAINDCLSVNSDIIIVCLHTVADVVHPVGQLIVQCGNLTMECIGHVFHPCINIPNRIFQGAAHISCAVIQSVVKQKTVGAHFISQCHAVFVNLAGQFAVQVGDLTRQGIAVSEHFFVDFGNHHSIRVNLFSIVGIQRVGHCCERHIQGGKLRAVERHRCNHLRIFPVNFRFIPTNAGRSTATDLQREQTVVVGLHIRVRLRVSSRGFRAVEDFHRHGDGLVGHQAVRGVAHHGLVTDFVVLRED